MFTRACAAPENEFLENKNDEVQVNKMNRVFEKFNTHMRVILMTFSIKTKRGMFNIYSVCD